MISLEEQERYKRQIMIDGFGELGQEKLQRAKVLVAGLGGLGSPAAIYLAAAGLGNLRIIDSDKVELSNLNRQILHWTQDIGRSKVASAKEKLYHLNPDIKIEMNHEQITQENVLDLVSDYDLILDATDNMETRYLLNRIAIEKKIPLCHGAVNGFEGRAITIIPGKTACLMCIYQGVDLIVQTPVFGFTAGVIACIQATEAIKYIAGIGQLLTNRFLIYDGLNMRFNEISVTHDPKCSHCSTVSK
jgi:molybdopterin/thiamine biosynthesis adenylyltransferase